MEARGYRLASYLGEGGGGGEGRRLGRRGDSATRAGRPLGIPFPSLPPLLAPPRPPPRSDSAGPGPLCVTASLVSASDRTAVFASVSDKVGCVWVPVSVCVCTCVSAHLVAFRACVGRVPVIMPVYRTLRGCLCLCVCLAPVSVFCLGLPLHHLRDHVCLCTCPSVFAFMFLNRVWETLEQADLLTPRLTPRNPDGLLDQ